MVMRLIIIYIFAPCDMILSYTNKLSKSCACSVVTTYSVDDCVLGSPNRFFTSILCVCLLSVGPHCLSCIVFSLIYIQGFSILHFFILHFYHPDEATLYLCVEILCMLSGDY